MKTKKFLKLILFILLSGVLLMFISGASKSEAAELIVDNSFDTILTSINNILTKNEQTEKVNSIIKNVRFDGHSYTVRIFCSENNDTQIKNARNRRIEQIEKGNFDLSKFI